MATKLGEYVKLIFQRMMYLLLLLAKKYDQRHTEKRIYRICVELIHFCLAPHKTDIGKQCRPRSDAAEHGV